MDLGTAKLQLAERLQDTSQANLARCQSWLLRAYEEMSARSEWYWLLRTRDWSTVVDDETYTLANSQILGTTADKILWMVIQAEKQTIQPISFEEYRARFPDPLDVSGVPQYYTVMDGVIYLYPVPDAVYLVTAQYQRKTTNITVDADSPFFPDKYAYVWLWGGEYYGRMFNDDERAPIARMEFERGLMSMRSDEEVSPNQRIIMSTRPFLPATPRGPYYPTDRF